MRAAVVFLMILLGAGNALASSERKAKVGDKPAILFGGPRRKRGSGEKH